MQRNTMGAAMFKFQCRARAAAATMYRSMAPEFLREARREWMRRARRAARPSNLAPLLTWLLDDCSGGVVAGLVESIAAGF